MLGIVIAMLLSLGSVALMLGAVIHNRVDPTYATALTLPLANALALTAAVLGLVIAVVVYRKDRESVLAKRSLIFALVCAVILAVLLPLSNMGYLSRVA